jgi:hypothetical protein
MRNSIAILAAIALIPATAIAADKTVDKKDPNRIICEKQGVVGSRLATKRVCMTAAEWETKRLEDRQAIEKAQVQRSSVSGN